MNTATAIATPIEGNADLEIVTAAQELAPARTNLQRGLREGLAQLNALIAHYPDKVREVTLAAQAFLVEHCGGDVSRFRGFAIEKLKRSESTSYYSNWLKGQYFASLKPGAKRLPDGERRAMDVSGQGLTNWVNFCRALMEHDRVTTAATKLGFVETGTTRAIHRHVKDVMDPLNPCRFGAIVGPTGSQKTAGLTLSSLKLGFPKAVRFECTTSMGLFTFARKWARCYNAKLGGPGSKGPVLLESLMEQQHPDHLVIIHNIQRAVQGGRDKEPIIEFLIEAQEDRKFPVILEFKQDWWEGMTEKEKGSFEQMIGRFGGEANMLTLPDYTPMADIEAIALANGIDSEGGMKLLADWSRLPGRIRNVFRRLYHAKKFARLEGETDLTIARLKQAAAYVPPATVEDDEGGES